MHESIADCRLATGALDRIYRMKSIFGILYILLSRQKNSGNERESSDGSILDRPVRQVRRPRRF